MFAFAKNLVKSAEGIINPEDREYVERREEEVGYGFRVLHVEKGSVAEEAGLESFFDFVIGLNGHELDTYSPPGESAIAIQAATGPPVDSFVAEINNCKGRSVSLDVWSAKGRIRRTIMMEVSAEKQLGMTVQWTPLAVADHIWHVLNVTPNSPAEKAGLISDSDYVVGGKDGLLAAGGETLLGRVITKRANEDENCEIELYVYNHDYDVVRPVTIKPNNRWGGSGLLGCGVGYGWLHRIPAVAGKWANEERRRSSSMYRNDDNNNLMPPGGTLFEATEDSSENYITPANLANAAPKVGSGEAKSPAAGKQRKHHPSFSAAPSATQNDLSEYFAEEEQKSRELEGRTGAKSESPDASVPPPPKSKH